MSGVEETKGEGLKQTGSPLPNPQFLLRAKDGLQLLACSQSREEEGKLKVTHADFPLLQADYLEWNPAGDRLAVAVSGSVTKIYSATGDEVCRLDGGVRAMHWSPLGSFLLTWHTPVKPKDGDGPPRGNLVVWEASTGRELHRMTQKSLKQWPSIQWTADEVYALRATADAIKIYAGDNLPAGPTSSIEIPKLGSFCVSGSTPSCHIATFVPEASGKPAKVAIYACPEGGAPIASRSSFNAQEISFKWSPDGVVLLGLSSADVDATGQSYYGSSNLFLMNRSDPSLDCAVALPKEGAVHSVEWAPGGVGAQGRRFAVCSGSMPAQTALFNGKGEQTFRFGTAHRNVLSWSPQGRFLLIAGFGNLAGHMDFWDTRRQELLGSTESHCAIKYGWSPDGRYFATATCAPRMNVDNGYQIFRYNGDPLHRAPIDQLFDLIWRPVPAGTYPDRPTSPGRKSVAPPQQAAAPSIYRPAAARGGGYSSVSALMNAERNKGADGPGKVGKAAPEQKKTQKELFKEKMARKAEQKAAAAEAEEVEAKTEEVTAKPSEPVDPEKRKKQIGKKLKQVEATKARRDAGSHLEKEQIELLSKEQELRDELERLNMS